jgi:hypothetical protein
MALTNQVYTKNWGNWEVLKFNLLRYLDINSFHILHIPIADEIVFSPVLTDEVLEHTRSVLQGEPVSPELLAETLVEVSLRDNYGETLRLIEALSYWFSTQKVGKIPLLEKVLKRKVQNDMYNHLNIIYSRYKPPKKFL